MSACGKKDRPRQYGGVGQRTSLRRSPGSHKLILPQMLNADVADAWGGREEGSEATPKWTFVTVTRKKEREEGRAISLALFLCSRSHRRLREFHVRSIRRTAKRKSSFNFLSLHCRFRMNALRMTRQRTTYGHILSSMFNG